jgi:hypothetical protein
VQNLDRAIGIDAVRAAAVRDVLFVLGQSPQALLQLIHRDRERARDVSRAVLAGRTRVEDDDVVAPCAVE